MKNNFFLKLKKIKSSIKCSKYQKKTLYALGLKKINNVVKHKATPQILGMIKKIYHLVNIKEIK
jgi:large subunit ribosomal protein L30